MIMISNAKHFPLKTAKKGAIAIVSIIIFTALISLITLNIAMMIINERRSQTLENQASGPKSFAISCVEEAMYRVRKSASYGGGSLNLDNHTCVIALSGSDSEKTLTVNSQAAQIYHTLTLQIQINVTQNARNVQILSWEET